MERDYLIHYGVLGMRWGYRKHRSPSGNSRSKSIIKSKKPRSNVKKTRKIKSSRIKQRLKNIDKQKIKRVAKSVAVSAGKVAALTALGSVGGALLINTINSINEQPSNQGSTISTSSRLYTNDLSKRYDLPENDIDDWDYLDKYLKERGIYYD